MSSENYTKKSAINSGVSLLASVFSCLLGFVSRSIFLRVLSAEYLGVNGLFSNILTMLSFAELGIGEAMVYAMYKPAKNGETEKTKSLVNFYKNAYLIISSVVFLVGFFLSFFLEFLISEKPNIPENLQLLFFLFLLNNIASYLMAHKQAILIVEQKRYVISLVTQCAHIGTIALQCIILFTTHNYYLYLLCQIVGTVFINLSLSVYVNHKYPQLKKAAPSALEKDERKTIFKDVKALSISKIAGVVSNGSDSIIISKLFGLLPVGMISNYSLIISTINGFVWSALSSITGSLGRFNVDSSLERKRRVFSELYLLTFWIYAFICICLMVLIDPFITVWLGEQYLVEKPIAAALIFIVYVSGLNFPFYTFRITSGIFDPMKYNYVLFAATNILLSIALGSWIGLLGIYAATFISRIICAEFKEGKIVFKDILQFSFFKYLLLYGGSALMLALTYVITQHITNLVPLDGWGGLFVKAFVCAALINLIFLLAFFRTNAFKGLLQKAKSISHIKSYTKNENK